MLARLGVSVYLSVDGQPPEPFSEIVESESGVDFSARATRAANARAWHLGWTAPLTHVVFSSPSNSDQATPWIVGPQGSAGGSFGPEDAGKVVTLALRIMDADTKTPIANLRIAVYRTVRPPAPSAAEPPCDNNLPASPSTSSTWSESHPFGLSPIVEVTEPASSSRPASSSPVPTNMVVESHSLVVKLRIPPALRAKLLAERFKVPLPSAALVPSEVAQASIKRPRLLELPTVPTLTGFSNLHHNLQAAQLTERDLAHKLESVRKSVAYYKPAVDTFYEAMRPDQQLALLDDKLQRVGLSCEQRIDLAMAREEVAALLESSVVAEVTSEVRGLARDGFEAIW